MDSAILLLHASPLFNKLGICDGQSGLRSANIETAAAKVIEVATLFPQYLDKLPMEAYSPMVINSLFQAAVVQREIVKERGGEEDREGLERVMEMLGMFDRRWKVAGMYSSSSPVLWMGLLREAM